MALITTQEITKLGRPIGKVNADQLQAFIDEAEQMYVRPMLGDKLYLSLLSGGDEYSELFDGGKYEVDGQSYMFMGLKQAVSYYVYAQNIMVGSFQSTSYGMVIKDSDYSHPISDKERSDAYNNALEVANCYMRDCVVYCKRKGLITTAGRARSAGSIRIRKIGN